jgi:hypothetical protein
VLPNVPSHCFNGGDGCPINLFQIHTHAGTNSADTYKYRPANTRMPGGAHVRGRANCTGSAMRGWTAVTHAFSSGYEVPPGTT